MSGEREGMSDTLVERLSAEADAIDQLNVGTLKSGLLRAAAESIAAAAARITALEAEVALWKAARNVEAFERDVLKNRLARAERLAEAVRTQPHGHTFIASDSHPAMSVKYEHESPLCAVCAALHDYREGEKNTATGASEIRKGDES